MKPFYLNGKWTSATQAEAVSNPWDGEPLAEICLATRDQVEEAVSFAHKAFPQVSRLPAWQRSETLARISTLLAARRAEFAQTIVAEAGKPIAFAEAEVDRAAMTFRFAADLAAADDGQVLRMDASPPGVGHFGLVRRFPIGLILGVTPFNFPLNLVAHKVAPCLASGNVMLLKPALKTPLSALLLAEVLEEAGVPAGQVNVVPFSHDFFPDLMADPRLRMLSFTGSAAVGWKLKAQAVKMRVALELGGNAAVLVEPDADWRSAIPKIASGAFGYAGQSCISVQRVLVARPIYEDFRHAFVEHVISQIKFGDPSDRQIAVGPMINASAREKILGWLAGAQAAGAKLLTPLEKFGASGLAPLVIEGAPPGCEIVCEEAFAPLAVLMPYDDFEDGLQKINASRYGLQAGVFTPDVRKALRAFDALDVGGVLINQVPTFRVENMPYGGIKDSGFGREGVRYAIDEMSEPKSLVLSL